MLAHTLPCMLSPTHQLRVCVFARSFVCVRTIPCVITQLHLPPPPPPTTTTISSGSSSTHQSPSHSRSSSTTSSSGYCNSSSLSPVQSNKVSPLHSRTSSENELHQYPAAKALPSCATTVYGSDFSFPPPPPPPLLQLATVPAAGMENPEVVPQQPPPVEPVDPAAFGPNGLAVADPTADSTDSAGAAAAGSNEDITTNDYGFLYKTIGGAVIRSVFPPGGAGSRYKVGRITHCAKDTNGARKTFDGCNFPVLRGGAFT